jgi:UDP-3-O-[3-hydroxymyristoyl] glucosamine N-acyltransferase
VIILGYGVELRRVRTLLEQQQKLDLAGVVPWHGKSQSVPDSVEIPHGALLLGHIDDLKALVTQHRSSVALAFSSPADRWEALGVCRQIGARIQQLCAGSADIAPDAQLKEGSLVAQGCLVESQATVGVGSLLLPGSRLGIAASCGDAAVLEAGAALDDGARIGDEVHLGSGARILAGRIVGRSALVLPGSIVTSDVEAGTIMSGSPAEVVQPKIFSEGDPS